MHELAIVGLVGRFRSELSELGCTRLQQPDIGTDQTWASLGRADMQIADLVVPLRVE